MAPNAHLPPDNRFEALAESAPDAILTIDEHSTILSANPATERIFGYAPEELVGKSLTVLIPKRLRAAHDAGVARYIRSGRKHIPWTGAQLPGLTKDGREIPMEISFGEFRDEQGRHVFSGFIRDVSERMRTEQELRRTNGELERLAAEERALRGVAQSITGAVRVGELMHQIAEGAIAVSGAAGAYVEQVVTAGVEVEVVAAAGERTPAVGHRVPFPGSLTEEIIGRREPIFLIRMEGFGAAMAPYLDAQCHGCSVLVVPLFGDDAVLGAIALIRKADDAPFDPGIVTRIRTLGDLASLALQRLATLADSERRRGEAEAAVRSRDEVLSIVSHDLRNPVSTVAMSASLLQDEEIGLDDAQRRQQLQIIARSAHRMNRLIQDLLDVARIEGGRLTISCRCEEPGALAAEACEAFRPIAEQKALRLEGEIATGVGAVYVDRDRVLQVLSNFLNNAVKFTPQGGAIVLRMSAAPEGGAVFSVSDTGAGIAADDLECIFGRFWQAKRTAHLGSGLGLSIAKGIADAHRGRVWAESAQGQGSTFYFAIPASSECP